MNASLMSLELCVIALGTVLLLADFWVPAERKKFLAYAAILALGGMFVLSFNGGGFCNPGSAFNGSFVNDALAVFFKRFFLLAAMLVLFIAAEFSSRISAAISEFYSLVLFALAGMLFAASANDFAMLFVSIELITITFYVLVSFQRGKLQSLEAGVKYLILGALSSAFMIFGIALIWGTTGELNIIKLAAVAPQFAESKIFLLGVLLVLVGLGFKIAMFPFQIWAPDVYQGAPTPTTAFLAIGSKAAGFTVLMILALDVFRPLQAVLIPVLSALAVATILFGNLAALTQSNVKRLMGLSGVSHAGYLLVGVIAAYREPAAVGAVYFYLLAYLLASFAVFAVMAHVSGANDADQDLEHYANLARERPFLGTVLAIGLGSLAGIPPLAGFMGKLLIFVFAFKAGLYGLLTVAVIGVVISIYYYFGWIRAAFFPSRPATDSADPESPRPVITPAGLPLAVAMVLLAAGSVVLGFYQGPFGAWFLAR